MMMMVAIFIYYVNNSVNNFVMFFFWFEFSVFFHFFPIQIEINGKRKVFATFSFHFVSFHEREREREMDGSIVNTCFLVSVIQRKQSGHHIVVAHFVVG